jgi:hypothetical protein
LTLAARSFSVRRLFSSPQRVHGSLLDFRPQDEQWPGRAGGGNGTLLTNPRSIGGHDTALAWALKHCRPFLVERAAIGKVTDVGHILAVRSVTSLRNHPKSKLIASEKGAHGNTLGLMQSP